MALLKKKKRNNLNIIAYNKNAQAVDFKEAWRITLGLAETINRNYDANVGLLSKHFSAPERGKIVSTPDRVVVEIQVRPPYEGAVQVTADAGWHIDSITEP